MLIETIKNSKTIFEVTSNIFAMGLKWVFFLYLCSTSSLYMVH